MPRDLPVGNGNMLVAFDSNYQLRELYFPYVGQANHTGGGVSRFGVWVDGNLAWSSDPGWERSMQYEPDTLVTLVRLTHRELGLKLVCHDCVDFDLNIYLRRIEIENLQPQTRDVRLFFHHNFGLGGNGDGNTAFYHPAERALVHYKGPYCIIINAMAPRMWGLSSYASGVAGHHGNEGTWRDAEDGQLGRNAITQGSVDSTAAVHVQLDRTSVVHYWIGAASDHAAALALNQAVRDLSPEAILTRVRAYWRQWVAHVKPTQGLSDEIRSFYKRSLLIVRTQVDNRGAILAANDSDTLLYSRDSYSYLWPRDGALVAQALDMAGYRDVSERFFDLCSRLITRAGYFMHKYNPDGTVGSSWHPWCGQDGLLELPIQEDETALVLYTLWDHFDQYRDIDFIRTIYKPLVERAGDFLCSHLDPSTGLPDSSWDLWEERRGISLFTVAAVWAGLAAAANFAEVFGDSKRADMCSRMAVKIKEATLEHMYDTTTGRFIRGLWQHGRTRERDTTMDSSQSGIFLFGMFAPSDPRVVRTMEAIADKLWCRTSIGGIARYERDQYFCTLGEPETPGNPWFLCTLWLAQWQIAIAETVEDLQKPRELLEWCLNHALESGVMAEQINPYNGSPLSVAPLTWSHATFVTTVIKWEERYRRVTDRRLMS